MIVNENNSIPYMKSLAICLNRIISDGYTEDFKVTESGIEALNEHVNYNPDQIEVVNFFRFEGESDPDDNSILYVLETNDGKKGTLIDAYGVYNDPLVSGFMQNVEVHKKVIKN
ncbi:MAG: hypothetical protein ACXWV9_00235 [Flavisolibacter sp.]